MRLPLAVLGLHPGLSRYAGKRVVVGIRPEDLHDASLADEADSGLRLRSTAELVEALGSDILVHFAIDAEAAVVKSSDSLQEIKGKGAGSRMVARFSPKSQVRIGAPVDVAIDVERLQFFDGETGDAIWG